jgi:uncharacterized protein YkwD
MFSKWLAVAVLAAGSLVQVPARAQDNPRQENGPDMAKAEKLILASTNEFRKEHGRGELKTNPELTRAARYFADFMARTDKYGHTADGKQPWERASKYGYDYCIVAENIAYEFNDAGFTTTELARGFFEGWKESPEHRKNMLDRDLDEIGIAVAHSTDTGRYYAVQDFGRPKSRHITFKINNRTDTEVRYAVDGKSFTIKPQYTMTHEACRPPKLVLQLAGTADGKDEPAADKGQVLHPANGASYVLRKDASGTIRIQKQ